MDMGTHRIVGKLGQGKGEFVCSLVEVGEEKGRAMKDPTFGTFKGKKGMSGENGTAKVTRFSSPAARSICIAMARFLSIYVWPLEDKILNRSTYLSPGIIACDGGFPEPPRHSLTAPRPVV